MITSTHREIGELLKQIFLFKKFLLYGNINLYDIKNRCISRFIFLKMTPLCRIFMLPNSFLFPINDSLANLFLPTIFFYYALRNMSQVVQLSSYVTPSNTTLCMPRLLPYYYYSPLSFPCLLQPPLHSINPLVFLSHLNSEGVKKTMHTLKKCYQCLVVY